VAADDSPKKDPNAVQQMQETAKWLLGLYAAVGALLMTGVQLTGFGRLRPGSPEFVQAVVAVGVAWIGICIAILCALAVLITGRTSLSSLAAREKRPDWRGRDKKEIEFLKAMDATESFTTLQELEETRDTVVDRNRASYKYAAWRADKTSSPFPAGSDVDPHIPDVIAKVNEAQQRVFQDYSYERVRRQFRASVIGIVAGSTLTLAAGLAFILVAHAEPPSDAVSSVPSEQTIQLVGARQTALASSLGPECVRGPIDVIVLGVTGQNLDVVAVPTEICQPIRFSATLAELHSESVPATGTPNG
jgi:hypothetical protein